MSPANTAGESGERIVVVEDDASVRRSLTNLLGSLGYDVDAFACAEDFLASATKPAVCLILDIKLPGMTGLELLRRLKQSGSTLRVVLLTAYGNLESQARARELGAAALLPKPFRTEELIAAVRGSAHE